MQTPPEEQEGNGADRQNNTKRLNDHAAPNGHLFTQNRNIADYTRVGQGKLPNRPNVTAETPKVGAQREEGNAADTSEPAEDRPQLVQCDLGRQST